MFSMRNKKIIFELSWKPSHLELYVIWLSIFSPLTSFGFIGSEYPARIKKYILLSSFCKHTFPNYVSKVQGREQTK